MPSLVVLIGTCLTAVAATAADRYDDRAAGSDAAPWWANSSAPNTTAPNSAAQPKVPDYMRPIGDAGAKGPALTSANAVAGVAEVAAEPMPVVRTAAKDGVASFGDRSMPESGLPIQARAPDAPARAAPALLQREADVTAAHLPSMLDQASSPLRKELTATDPSLEASNVLRPSTTPAVVPTAATSPAPAASAAPKPIPVPTKAPPIFAPPPSFAPPPTLTTPASKTPSTTPSIPSTTTSSDAAQAAETTQSLALGGHGDKSLLGKSSPISAMFTVGGSLSIVLGLFLVVAWAMRKTAPRGSHMLPKEVFEILGRAPLGARQQVQLLRCGGKLLLVSITPHGTETLTEVTDPLEVDRIAGICQQGNPKSSSAAFRQVFQQVAKPGATESAPLDLGPRRKKYRWEKEHA